MPTARGGVALRALRNSRLTARATEAAAALRRAAARLVATGGQAREVDRRTP